MKVAEKKWLTPQDGDVEKRWFEFLDKKRQATTNKSHAEAQSQTRVRQDPAEGSTEESRDQPDESLGYEKDGIWIYPIGNREQKKEKVEERTDSNDDREIEARHMLPLFASRNWDALIFYIQSFPSCATVPLTCGPNGLTISRKGNFLLHEVCRIDPPVALIDALIGANKAALQRKGEKGCLPLHYACACASTDVVKRLVEAYPEATKIRNDSDLMLPLHIACKWGFSKGTLEILHTEYPEGANVRDIYAMIPMDYVSDLSDDECLKEATRCLNTKTNVSNSMGLLERSGKTFTEVREDLDSANMKLERVTSELDNREQTFALMLGREQEKVRLLEEERDNLLKESKEDKTSLIVRAGKIELLEKEVKMLKALQKSNAEKRTIFEKKIEVLETAHGVKEHIIGRLEDEIKSSGKDEWELAMQHQENNYRHLLEEEKQRSVEMWTKLEDEKSNHHVRTKTILQEHEDEIFKLEDITRKYEILERQLRDKLEVETIMRDAVEMEMHEKDTKFQQQLKTERDRNSYLEKHIQSLNLLLEGEQQRFNELEALVEEALPHEGEAIRDKLEKNVTSLEAELEQKEKILQSQESKIHMLEQEHGKTLELLQSEREELMIIREEYEANKGVLGKGEQELAGLEKSFEEAERLMESDNTGLSERLSVTVAAYNRALELEAEKKKVNDLTTDNDRLSSELRDIQLKTKSLEQEHAKNKELLTAEMKKVENLERTCDQLQELLQWERSNGQNGGGKLHDLMEKLKLLETELSSALSDLQEKEMKVQGLTEQLEYFEWMKAEVVRLSAESRKRDMMLGGVLEVVDTDEKAVTSPSVQNAKAHMEDMKRIIGLDLAGDMEKVFTFGKGQKSKFR